MNHSLYVLPLAIDQTISLPYLACLYLPLICWVKHLLPNPQGANRDRSYSPTFPRAKTLTSSINHIHVSRTLPDSETPTERQVLWYTKALPHIQYQHSTKQLCSKLRDIIQRCRSQCIYREESASCKCWPLTRDLTNERSLTETLRSMGRFKQQAILLSALQVSQNITLSTQFHTLLATFKKP